MTLRVSAPFAVARDRDSLRLAGEKYARVAPERASAHAEAVRALWRAVLGD